MNYGVPYKGSKSKIAEWVVSNLPEADNFYDLFAGGCAVTHCALLSGKYQNYYANDLWTAPRLFLDAANGKYRDEKRWISREQFDAERLTDPYIQFCWSFGDDGRSYLYSREIESEMRKRHFDYLSGKPGGKKTDDIRRTDRLRSLAGLKNVSSLEISQGGYEKVGIKGDSVIYCDIPYKGTEGYDSLMKAHIHPQSSLFDYESFYEWCARQTELVVVSEYAMPDDFVCVGNKKKLVTNCATQTTKATERLFVPKHQVELYKEMTNSQGLLFPELMFA